MKHIIEDRCASIYSTYLPGFRDGPSCPVVFNKRLQVSRWWNRQGGYQAYCSYVGADGREYVRLVQKPTESDNVLTFKAYQRADYITPVLG